MKVDLWMKGITWSIVSKSYSVAGPDRTDLAGEARFRNRLVVSMQMSTGYNCSFGFGSCPIAPPDCVSWPASSHYSHCLITLLSHGVGLTLSLHLCPLPTSSGYRAQGHTHWLVRRSVAHFCLSPLSAKRICHLAGALREISMSPAVSTSVSSPDADTLPPTALSLFYALLYLVFC